MIKAIVGTGHIVVNGGTNSAPYISPGSRSGGILRYNETLGSIEVYDGLSWQQLSVNIPSIALTPNASTAIDWVMNKMAQEAKYEALAKDNTAVKIALDNLEKAKQQLDVTIILSKNT